VGIQLKPDFETLLHYAALNKVTAVAEYLLSRGAGKCLAVTTSDIETPLDWAEKRNDDTKYEMTSLLLACELSMAE